MAAARIVLCLFFCTTRAHSNVDIISEPRPGQEYVLVSSGQQTPLRQLESSHNIPEKHSLSLSLKHDGVDEKSRKNLHKPMEKHPKEAIIYIDEDKKSSFGNGQRVEASETLEIDIPVSKLKDIEIKETVKDKVITPKIGDALEALSEFDNSNNKLATQALKPVLTTEPPSATKGFNYIPISFDIIDDINSGLFSSNIHLESAGSEQKQHSRIQIKKGPNGQDYEYEYVYYYFDDDNKRDAKDIQEKISSTTAAPVHNTHDGPPNVDTEAQMFMNQYNTINRSETSTATDENQNEVVLTVSRNQQRGPIMAPSPVDEIIVEDRLPSSTRFPPRNHNFDVSSMMTSLSQVSSEAANHYRLHQTDNIADESSEHTRSRTHQHVRRPSSELVDLVSFKTYSGDVPLQYKEPPSRYISESKATTEIPVTAPTVRKPVQNKASHREPHTFQEILDVSKLPTVYKFNSTENTTEHTTMTFMGKVALDLYAYLARENLNNEVSGFVNADAFTATDDKGYTAKVLTTEESKTTTTPVPKATMSIIVSPLTRPLRSRSQLGVRGRIPTFTGGTIEAPQEISNNTRGKTPAELFFKRQFRDKLPSTLDTEFAIVDLEVKDKDTEMKAKGKEYADRKRRAVESDIGQGEKTRRGQIAGRNRSSSTTLAPTQGVNAPQSDSSPLTRRGRLGVRSHAAVLRFGPKLNLRLKLGQAAGVNEDNDAAPATPAAAPTAAPTSAERENFVSTPASDEPTRGGIKLSGRLQLNPFAKPRVSVTQLGRRPNPLLTRKLTPTEVTVERYAKTCDIHPKFRDPAHCCSSPSARNVSEHEEDPSLSTSHGASLATVRKHLHQVVLTATNPC